MMLMTRMAIGAGMAAVASVSLGAGAVSAVPPDTSGAMHQSAAVPGKYEIWDYYSSESECRAHGFDGRNDDRWVDFKCRKGIGKYKNVFGLYVEYREGHGAPTDPTDLPYYDQPNDDGDGDGDGVIEDGDVGEESITR